MMSRAFHHFSDVPLAVLGMMIFLTVFIGMVARVLLQQHDSYNRVRNLPLEEEQ